MEVAHILAGNTEFHVCIGNGIHLQETMENVNGICALMKKMRFSEYLGRENGNRTPIQDSHFWLITRRNSGDN